MASPVLDRVLTREIETTVEVPALKDYTFATPYDGGGDDPDAGAWLRPSDTMLSIGTADYSFQPSIEAIVAFEPDLVYVFSDQGGVVEGLRQTGTPVLYLKSPATLAGVFENIALLGEVTDRAPAARALIAALEERRDAVRLRVEDVAQGPRFFHEISPDYYTVRGDTFAGGLYTLLKGENVAAGSASTYPQLSAEAIVERDPEVIILVDGVEAAAVGERPGWGGVSAVRDGRICEVDPDLVSRPGPRIIDGLEALADCLYPEAG